MFQRAGAAWVLAVYFPRSNPSFAEIKTKFKSDLAGALRHSPSGSAFVTNQELTLGQRAELGKLAHDVQLEIFHMERVAALLDQPMMAGVRWQFLGIDSGPVPLSITLAIDGIGRFFSSGVQVREILLDREDGSLRDDAEQARSMPAAERETEAQMARILNRPAPAEPPSAAEVEDFIAELLAAARHRISEKPRQRPRCQAAEINKTVEAFKQQYSLQQQLTGATHEQTQDFRQKHCSPLPISAINSPTSTTC